MNELGSGMTPTPGCHPPPKEPADPEALRRTLRVKVRAQKGKEKVAEDVFRVPPTSFRKPTGPPATPQVQAGDEALRSLARCS